MAHWLRDVRRTRAKRNCAAYQFGPQQLQRRLAINAEAFAHCGAASLEISRSAQVRGSKRILNPSKLMFPPIPAGHGWANENGQ